MKPEPKASLSMASTQKGVALFTSLIILVVLTLVTLASLSTSLVQLRMSSNEEMRTAAFQTAQAAIDDLINIDYKARQTATADPDKQYFNLTGAPNHTQCSTNWSDTSECDTTAIVLSPPLDSSVATGASQIKIVRISETVRTGNTKCPNGYNFKIESIYDRSALGQGKSHIVQGFMGCDYVNAQGSMVPKSADHN